MATWLADAERLLSTLGTVRPYALTDFGRARKDTCRSVLVAGGDTMVQPPALAALAKVRKALPPGTVAYLGTTRWLGEEQHPGKVELVIGPGADQFDCVRLAESDAINYDLDTEAVIAKLRTYDERYGIDLFHAETDTIEFDVKGAKLDWKAFAQDLYEFCPDIVDQGVGSVEALRAMLIDTGRVYLWWD